MKKFWVNVGKAAAYFGTYYGAQFVISFVISLVISVFVSISMVQPDGSFDMDAYTEKAMAVLGEVTPYILIVSGIVTLIVFFVVAKIRKKKLTQSAGLNKFKASTIAPVIIGGISFNYAISYAMSLIPFPESWVESYQTNSSQLLGGTSVAFWIAVVIMAPLVEELTFRGFVYTRLKQGMKKWIAVIVTSLLFGMVHGTIIWAMYTFVFSLCLIYIFEKTNSLWTSILFHFAFNLAGMLLSSIPKLAEKMDGIVWMIGSFVVVIVATGWFVLVTKNSKKEVLEETV